MDSILIKGLILKKFILTGLLSVDAYDLVDDNDGKTISITFRSALSDSSVVQLKLVVRGDFTQVEKKLIVNTTNPSRERIDVEIDASKIIGKINKDRIPKLSHVGLKDSVMMPVNPNDGDDEVIHRTESFGLDDRMRKEFFPVFSQRSNARNALFLMPDTANEVIYTCASNDILFSERGSSEIATTDITGTFPYFISPGTDSQKDP